MGRVRSNTPPPPLQPRSLRPDPVPGSQRWDLRVLAGHAGNLDPTFGVTDGAELLDVYVHVPGAVPASTAAAFASRNYTIATAGAWSQRLEVQGFAAPEWVDASGNAVGTPLVLANQSDRTITIALPEDQFGVPGPGWGFSVVLTGQDGFSPDQARAFTSTPGAFTFGVFSGRLQSHLFGGPGVRAEGHGRDHPARGVAIHRARSNPRPGNGPAGYRALGVCRGRRGKRQAAAIRDCPSCACAW